jgi:hypothetical protein
MLKMQDCCCSITIAICHCTFVVAYCYISFEADALKQAFQKISSSDGEKQHAEDPTAANNNSNMKITTSARHHHQSYNKYPSQNDDVVDDDDSANLEYMDDAEIVSMTCFLWHSRVQATAPH